MDYRDDREALRQRLEVLELENAALQRENEQLKQPPPPEPIEQPARVHTLAPAPRKISFALAFSTLFHLFTFNMVIFGVWLVVLPAGYALATHQPLAWIFPYLVPGFMLLRNLRALYLLMNGVAAPAAVLEADDSSSWSYSTNVGRSLAGWGDQGDEYGGSFCKTRVRIGLPDGPFAERTLRGRPYEGGMFLFDPAKPSRNVGTWELPVPVRPGPDGQLPTSVGVFRFVLGLLGAGALGVLLALPVLPHL